MLQLKCLVLCGNAHQECESEGANKMIEHLRDLISKSKTGDVYGKLVLIVTKLAEEFIP